MLMAIDEEHHEEGDKDGMKMYLEDKTKIDLGPLTWWQKNEEWYPKLARATKLLHSIFSTSNPSKHIFSKARFIVNKDTFTPYRNSSKYDISTYKKHLRPRRTHNYNL